MEVTTSRRKAFTYGKASRKPLVHDLFDVGVEFDACAGNTEEHNSSMSHTAKNTDPTTRCVGSIGHWGQSAGSPSPPRQLEYEFPYTSLQAQASDDHASANGSPFDLLSSDEEASTKRSLSQIKRRKITQSRSQANIGRERQPGKSRLQAQELSARIERGQTELVDSKNRALFAKSTSHTTHNPLAYSRPAVKHTAQPVRTEDGLKASGTQRKIATEKTIRAKVAQTSKTTRATSPKPLIRKHNSEILSREEPDWPASNDITPKRKRRPATNVDATPSPSNLELGALRLTPVRTPSSPTEIGRSRAGSHGSITPGRTKSRLVDKLDAPSEPDARSEGYFDLDTNLASGTKFHTLKGEAPRQPERPAHGERPLSMLQQTDSSQSITAHSRPKPTYAKQRSHLSDMMDDVGSLVSSESQQSVLSTNSQVSSFASQMELEPDDSDDPTTTGRLKSIHELRRAGASNRFDRDVELLMEDIEAGPTLSKALRLQALGQLIKRLRESAFLAHFVHGNFVYRLTACVSPKLDLLSAILFVVVIEQLAAADALTVKTLMRLFEATANLAPTMLKERRPLAKLANDRKQNLSKASVKDMAELEQYILEHGILQGHSNSSIPPQLLALSVLQRTLKSLLGHYEPVTIPTSLVAGALLAIQGRLPEIRNGTNSPAGLEVIKLALSWLELCCADHSGGIHSYVEQDKSFANTLADVTILPVDDADADAVQHSVLRLVVSLSNNNPSICHGLSGSALARHIFAVIDEHFLRLAKAAEQEEALDDSKLDTVILALGCWLNFTDCDASIRASMLETVDGNPSQLERLLLIFNELVSQATEVHLFAPSPATQY